VKSLILKIHQLLVILTTTKRFGIRGIASSLWSSKAISGHVPWDATIITSDPVRTGRRARELGRGLLSRGWCGLLVGLINLGQAVQYLSVILVREKSQKRGLKLMS